MPNHDTMRFSEILKKKAAEIAHPLERGERVELIPTKDDVRVFSIRRQEVKQNTDSGV